MALLSVKIGEEVSLDDLYGLTQKIISHKIDLKLQLSLTSSVLELTDKPRLASLNLAHAGDRLNTIPSPILALHVRPEEFRYSVLYRLGAPIYRSAGPCPACRKPSDRYGHHAIVCGSHGERIARHHHLRDALFQAAATANLAPRKEEGALLLGTAERPAAVLIPNWSGGRDTALDVTVVSPLTADRIARSADNPGHTLKAAFDEKCRLYHRACEREGIVFVPLLIETLGGWHEKAIDQVRKIARAQARNMGTEEDEAARHLFQRLGILLVKGNAALLVNCVPTFSPPEVDGHM